MHDFIVCAVFKNESHILEEWITHYLYRGVDHIYLVNDFSTDEFIPIIEKFSNKVTLFHNDIVTKAVGRQTMICDKYFDPILHTSKWAAIIDLDEFLYSPQNRDFKEILREYDAHSQIKVDWLHFGSNGHELQPISAVAGFTKRAKFTTSTPGYYSTKTIFKPNTLISKSIHSHNVRGNTIHFKYSDASPPPLVINHYNLQSREFFFGVKATRGDVNNWFDHNKSSRDEKLFVSYDINDVEDLRLFEQNKGIYDPSAKISKGDDVTLVITSCNRPHLLEKTLASFMAMNTYPIAKTLLIDDSGKIGCNDAVLEKYKDKLNMVVLYNTMNIGQVESIDKVYSYVRTKWIFHCEEDWAFLQPGFIEKSFQVFQENPTEKIYTVWLRPHHSTSGHPIIRDSLNRGYYMMKKDYAYRHYNEIMIWGGITFNPGLRKTTDCLKHHPYSICCNKMVNAGKTYVGEYSINKKYVDDGYYAMILADPAGHIDHIGWNDHIPRHWD